MIKPRVGDTWKCITGPTVIVEGYLLSGNITPDIYFRYNSGPANGCLYHLPESEFLQVFKLLP